MKAAREREKEALLIKDCALLNAHVREEWSEGTSSMVPENSTHQ